MKRSEYLTIVAHLSLITGIVFGISAEFSSNTYLKIGELIFSLLFFIESGNLFYKSGKEHDT